MDMHMTCKLDESLKTACKHWLTLVHMAEIQKKLGNCIVFYQ